MGAVEESRPDMSAGPLRMPPPPEETTADLQEALRNFSFAGEAKRTGAEENPGLSLDPAVLTRWSEPGLAWHDFPLYIPPPTADGTVTTLATLLGTILDGSGAESTETNVLRDNLWRLLRAATRAVEALDGSADVRPVMARACDTFLAEFETSEAGRRALQARLEDVTGQLPGEGMLLGRGPHTLLALVGAAVRRRREPARQRFREEVKMLLARMEERLVIDRMHAPEGSSAESLREAMGGAAESFVDSDALAGLLPPHRGTRPLDPQRRRRIEQAVDILTGYLASEGSGPDYVLVHSGDVPAELPAQPGATVKQPDSFAAAANVFDQVTDEFLPVIRALRTARLEAAERYQPDIHDARLARLDARSLTADERTLPRAVVVLETAETLENDLAGSFSRLLLSGRPIHALVLYGPMGRSNRDAGPDFGDGDPGLGYRSIAHRKAFVLQSTLAQPAHLAAGLEAMLRADRAAVAFVGGALWPGDEAPPRRQSVAEHEGRALPCFSFAPDAGATTAERFDLSRNPRPHQTWPRYTIPYLDHNNAKDSLDTAVTFADCAALLPSSRKHFWVLPSTAWDDDQVELSAFLAATGAEPPKGVPYIWVRDAEGLLQRAVVGRQLILACRERMEFWHTLRELAGIDEARARHRPEDARAGAAEAVDTTSNQGGADPAAAPATVQALAEAAAVNRLVAALMSMAGAPTGAPIVPPTGAPARPEPAAEAVPGETVEKKDEKAEETGGAASEDPWMETALCTTCDECININASAFAYNQNKQARFVNASAATFAELVKAAELCPAHCIHPGTPRPGDTTVTDALRRKADTLN